MGDQKSMSERAMALLYKLIAIAPLLSIVYMVVSCPCSRLCKCKVRAMCLHLALFAAFLFAQWCLSSA
jgi:hypothetical protein